MEVYDAESIAQVLEQAVRDHRIHSLVREIVESKTGLVTVNLLQRQLKARLNVDVKRTHLVKILKTDLALKWGPVRSQYPYENSAKNIVLRQIFARVFLQQILASKTILNFDETSFTGTTSRRYSYRKPGRLAQRLFLKSITGLSLFLTVSSKGQVYY